MSSSDSDYESDEEPKLKYQSLTKQLTSTYRNGDATSAFLAVGDKVVIGTHNGNIHILALTTLRTLRSYHAHSATITSLSISPQNSEDNHVYIASSSIDGNVCVASLIDPKDVLLRSFGRPVQAVALSPEFKSDRTYISGGLAGNLVLTVGGKAGTTSTSSTSSGNMMTPGWLSSLGLNSGAKDTILHSGEGAVGAIKWSGKYVAWTNEKGIKVMQSHLHDEAWKRVTHVDRPVTPIWDEMCNSWRARILWDKQLIVGWGDALWIIDVEKRELVKLLRTDCTIAGIAKHDDMVLMLAYTAENKPAVTETPRKRFQGAHQPELRIVDPKTSEQDSADTLVISRYKGLSSSDYHLEQITVATPEAKQSFQFGLNIFSSASTRSGSSVDTQPVTQTPLSGDGVKTFVVSPYDCILVMKRDFADHIAWLVENEQFEEAWTALGESDMYSEPEKEKRRIGEMWVQQLIDAGEWKKAGQICRKVLNTPTQWEHWWWIFANADKIPEITPYLPLKLPPTVYEIALGYYVTNDTKVLRSLLHKWPSTLYDATTVIEAIKNKEDKSLDDVLASLYLNIGQPREALPYYLEMKDETALRLIRDYHLMYTVSDIPGFILLSVSHDDELGASFATLESLTAETVSLLAAEPSISPQTVIDQLGDKQLYLFFYFKALWNNDKTLVDPYADIVVELFAEYNRELLMRLLKSSQAYTFDRAVAVCERNDYIPELVYLLSKTGQMRRALFLIIDRLHDVHQAITFAKEQNDHDLWNDLLDYSMDKPEFIRGLLEEVGTAIDPIALVRRIPEGLEIEGLRDGLSRMVREHEIQWSISDGVARVLRGEVAITMEKLRRSQRQGLRFEPKCNCGTEKEDTMIGFACGHLWHLGCLSEPDPSPALATRGVAAKVTRARLLKDKLRGCPLHVD